METVLSHKPLHLFPEKTSPRVLLYDDCLEQHLHHFDADLSIPLQVAEPMKTRETKAWIENKMLDAGIGRTAELVSFGGGIVTDIGGFVAATYCRGIRSIYVPSTLLGMVDAAIGGKTGVNTQHGKNMIGAIYPPHLVHVDISLLETLSDAQIRSGAAEMLKYGCIAHPSLLECHTGNLKQAIHLSQQCKLEIVAEDPYEQGKRRTLNFGHTFAHALEVCSQFSIPHGDAVALGLKAALYLSNLRESELDRALDAIDQWKFPIYDLPPFEVLFSTMMTDKKRADGNVRFVLLQELGKTDPFKGNYCTPLTKEAIHEAYCFLHEVHV